MSFDGWRNIFFRTQEACRVNSKQKKREWLWLKAGGRWVVGEYSRERSR